VTEVSNLAPSSMVRVCACACARAYMLAMKIEKNIGESERREGQNGLDFARKKGI
jgi:hypothetical protein